MRKAYPVCGMAGYPTKSGQNPRPAHYRTFDRPTADVVEGVEESFQRPNSESRTQWCRGLHQPLAV